MQIRSIVRRIWFVLAFLIIQPLLLISMSAQAAGLEMSPPSVEIEVDPGTEQTFDIAIGNTSDTEVCQLKVRLSSIEQAPDGSYSLSENSAWSAVPWLSLKSETITLQPKGQGAAIVTVKVPRGASGSKTAAVVFEIGSDSEDKSKESITSGGMAYTYCMASIIKVTAKNRANRFDASVKGLNVLYPLDNRYGDYGQNAMAVVCTVTNEGNTVIHSRGRLLIRDLNNRRVKEAPLGDGQGTILPGATVELVSIFPVGIPKGKYFRETDVAYGSTRPIRTSMPFEISAGKTSAGEADVQKAARLSFSSEFINTQIPAGALRTLMINLTNKEAYPLKVSLNVDDLAAYIDGTFQAGDSDNGKWAAKSWLESEDKAFTVAPGEKKNLKITVRVPKGIDDGTYYTALSLQALKDGGGSSDATTLYDIPLVINVGKSYVKTAAIDKIWLEKPEPSGPVWVCSDILNRGNTHFTVSGKLVIRKKARQQMVDGIEYLGESSFEDIDTIDLGDTKGWVLPGASLAVQIPYEKPLQAGEYQAEIIIDYGENLPVRQSVGFMITTPVQKRRDGAFKYVL